MPKVILWETYKGTQPSLKYCILQENKQTS